MKKRVADIIVDVLAENGIDACFSVVGGGAMHLNNAFALAQDRIKTIYNHHEQACSMAAEGYARLTGRIAAVCVTSGPGGTNAINGVQGAWVDSLPMIVISGFPRYATSVASTGLDLRVRGVQENDIISQVASITKYAKMLLDPRTARREVQHAIDLALDGRRGPVWLCVPLDVQSALVGEDELLEPEPLEPRRSFDPAQLEELDRLFKNSRRPCILTGSGIRTGAAHELYREFSKTMKVPIVGGAQQADIDVNGTDYFYGMSGGIGPRCGNFILQSADLILVLGNSLGTNQTGFNVEGFAPNAKIIMVDAQADEARKPGLHVDFLIHADLKDFFLSWVAEGYRESAPQAWIDHCNLIYSSLPRYETLDRHASELEANNRVPSLLFWKEFLSRLPSYTTIALGNSSCGHGLLQVGIEKEGQRSLVNYNCGSMGHDLPEAIGACVGARDTVYCITGDGSVMMNLQELETIRHHSMPIKLVVFNDNGYAAIRRTCNRFFDGRHDGSDPESGVGFPDFSLISTAFGFPYRLCPSIGELGASLDWLIASDGPCMLEISQRLDDFTEPRITSRMDENGCFTTPPVHDMDPALPNDLTASLLLNC